MYKVLIVDDEYYVMSLIQEIIDWDKLGMQVVGTADNGYSALELMHEKDPDIMIVDVRMPGYDGITLMQKAREVNSRVKFIVISGHKRFEYAKSAMKYNVEDYLLKPISKNELESILIRLKDKIKSEEATQHTIETLDTQLDQSKNKMHSMLLTELLAGGENLKNLDLEAINKEYLTDFSQGTYCVAAVKIDCGGDSLNQFFLDELMQALFKSFIEQLSSICKQCICKYDKMRIYYLLQFNLEVSETQFVNILQQCDDNAVRVLAKYERIYQTIGIGEFVSSIVDTTKSATTAEKAIDSRFDLGLGKIITAEKIQEDRGLLRMVLSDQRSDEFSAALKSLDTVKIANMISELFERAYDYKNDTTLVMRVCRKIHHVFYEYVCHIDIFRGSWQELYDQMLPELEKCSTKQEICTTLINHITEYIKNNVNNGSEDIHPAVRVAMRYVQENYQKNITLFSISDVVNLTSVYFCILFKRETGVTFIDYLNKFRVDTAKKMLKDTRFNINEIAEKCGYQDSRYFSRTFKKIIGITPSEYRSRQLQ